MKWVLVKQGKKNTEFQCETKSCGQDHKFRILYTQSKGKHQGKTIIGEKVVLHRMVNGKFSQQMSYQSKPRYPKERPHMEALIETAQARAHNSLRLDAGEITPADMFAITQAEWGAL